MRVRRLELGIALSLDKRGVRRDTFLAAGNIRKELGMSVAVNLHALHGAIGEALVGVNEAVRVLALSRIGSDMC